MSTWPAACSRSGSAASCCSSAWRSSSSRIVEPLRRALGRPAARIAGVAGRLARDNSIRNPSRTAVTASALMIGLALVTFVAVLGQGLRSSFGVLVRPSRSAPTTSSPRRTASRRSLRRPPRRCATIPASTTLTTIREDQVKAFGDTAGIDRIEPDTIASIYNFQWDGGSPASLQQLGDDGAVVNRSFADEHGLAVGERFRATAPDGTTLNLAVRGIDDPESFDPLGLGDIMVAPAALRPDVRRPSATGSCSSTPAGRRLGAASSSSVSSGSPSAKLWTQARVRRRSGEPDQRVPRTCSTCCSRCR